MIAPIVVVLVLATLGILYLRGEQREQESARFEVERLHAVLHAYSALEWKAIADAEIPTGMTEEAARLERQIRASAASVAANHEVEDGAALAERVDAYLEAAQRELGLIALGRIAEARDVDETIVDPIFEMVEEFVQSRSLELHGSAAESARNADRGTIAIAIATLLALLYQGFRILRIEKEAARRAAVAAARAERENDLREAQRMEAAGRLAGGIAHDFNNLLTVVMGYGGLVVHELEPDHPCQDSMARVLGAAERASALTRQLLAFGRKQILAPAEVELGAVCEELLPLLEGAVKGDVAVALEVADRVQVYADAHQLGQVLLNLVVNAGDAMPNGGRIDVVVGTAELPHGLKLRGERLAPGRYAELLVADTGVGIDQATVEKIFEPYFTTKASGNGLGLSSVAGIVAQSGGLIDVETAPGVGSRFRVYLPLCAALAGDAGGEPVPHGAAAAA